jgi:glycosyltransferase 2 family protein
MKHMQRLCRARWFKLISALGVAIAWIVFLGKQLYLLVDYPLQNYIRFILVAVVFGGLHFFSTALCWAFLFRSMSQEREALPLLQATRVWMYSMVARYIPGNIWHILGRIARAADLSISPSLIFASAVLEQILMLIGAFAVAVALLPLSSIGGQAVGWSWLFLAAGIAFLHPRMFGVVLTWLFQKLQQPGLDWKYTYTSMLLMAAAYCLPPVFAGMSLLVILSGFVSIGVMDMVLVIGASAFAWVVGYLSFATPSGLGVREAVLVGLLAQVYPLPVAILVSLLGRLTLTLGEIVTVVGMWAAEKLAEWKKERRHGPATS